MTKTAIEIGKTYTFDYGDYGGGPDDCYPEYSARRGKLVTVLRQLTSQETKDYDSYVLPIFVISTPDGWTGEAFTGELA